MNYTYLLIYILLCISLIIVCKKNSIFVDYKKEKHKRYSSHSRTYSVGGVFFLIFLFYYYYKFNRDISFLIFYISIFFIGILSDLKQLNSVKLRFFFQIFFIFTFVYLLEISILNTRIVYFDNLLKYDLINILFVTFCLLVLINGGNFIDGINGLLIKYNLIIFTVIYLFFQNHSGLNNNLLICLIHILTFLLILNLSGHIYMGDSGAYLLSLFTGSYLILFAYQNPLISPYMIIIFLWYPCFELLFSMIRRLFGRNKTYEPDTYHLHQLIYLKIKNICKFNNNLYFHILTSLVINIYNLLVFIIATKFIYSSFYLNTLIFLNIFVYISVYFSLKKNLFKETK